MWRASLVLTRGPNDVASSAGYDMHARFNVLSRTEDRMPVTHVTDSALLGLFDKSLDHLVVDSRLHVDCMRSPGKGSSATRPSEPIDGYIRLDPAQQS